MGIPSGPFYVDDLLTWTENTHTVTTGAATDADSVPTYRIYEDETGTAITTGSMAKLDDANTTGFYSEQITLSAANGYEVGKSYSIYISSTVNSITATKSENFKVVASASSVSIAAGGITTGSFAAGAINAAAIATDAIGAAELAADAVGEIADAVWNEFVAAGLVITSSSAAAGSSSTITLDSGASATDNLYNGLNITIAGGTGASQTRTITGYVGSTKVATVHPNWTTNPAAASLYTITPNSGTNVTTWRASTPNQLVSGRIDASVGAMAADTLTASALATDAVTEIQSGLSAPSAATIADAVWDEVLSGHLTAGTTGAALDASGGGVTAAAIADAVWDELVSGHAVAGSFGAQITTIDDFLDTEVTAIKTKTDFLPSATAGAAGGLFIAGTNAATTITGSLTTTFTGNVTGSVGTVNAFAANSITAAATAADYVTEIQAGLATAAALTVVDDFLDTEVAAIKVVTDKLDTAMVLDGAVYQFTVNALELGPSGSGASAASIADAVWDEVLSGHLTAGTTGAALNGAGGGGSAWDEATSGHVTAGTFGKLVADINAKTTNLPPDPADASDIAASFGAIELASDAVDEIADAVWAVTARTLTANTNLNDPTAADVADAVWDEVLLGHLTAGTTGEALILSPVGATPADIADAVWNEALGAHLATGSTGAALDAGSSTAAEIATEVYDQTDGIEAGLTLRQAMRLSASALFGEASGLATTTATYRDFSDTKDRIVATVDDDGNRIALTLDPF